MSASMASEEKPVTGVEVEDRSFHQQSLQDTADTYEQKLSLKLVALLIVTSDIHLFCE